MELVSRDGRLTLLHEHYKKRALSGTAVAADEEELLPERLALSLGSFDFEKLGSIVHVSSGLNVVRAQALHGVEGLVPLALFHVPSRRFWAEVDLDHDKEWRDRRRG